MLLFDSVMSFSLAENELLLRRYASCRGLSHSDSGSAGLSGMTSSGGRGFSLQTRMTIRKQRNMKTATNKITATVKLDAPRENTLEVKAGYSSNTHLTTDHQKK